MTAYLVEPAKPHHVARPVHRRFGPGRPRLAARRRVNEAMADFLLGDNPARDNADDDVERSDGRGGAGSTNSFATD